MSEVEEKLRILNLLVSNPGWIDILKEALEVEGDKKRWYEEQGYGEFIGWEWYMVHTAMPRLHKMVTEKVIDLSLSTRSGKYFKIHDPELISEVIKTLEEQAVEAPKEEEIPDDLFSDIVGYDNIKSLLNLAIQAEQPVHVLLSGVPASSKTLFLIELNRLPNSYYALGGTMSSAGLADILLTREPGFLLIDEIDRLRGEDMGVLNSLMATGRVVITKWGKIRAMELNTKVFAAGIRVNILPRDLLSRFVKLSFKPYTEQEFMKVSSSILILREGLVPELADKISKMIWDMGGEQADIRQSVSIGRLISKEPEKFDEVIRTIKRFGWKVPY